MRRAGCGEANCVIAQKERKRKRKDSGEEEKIRFFPDISRVSFLLPPKGEFLSLSLPPPRSYSTMCAKTIKSEPGSFCLLHGARKKRGENKDSFCTGERTKNVFFYLFLLSLPPPHENAKGKKGRKEGRRGFGQSFFTTPTPPSVLGTTV